MSCWDILSNNIQTKWAFITQDRRLTFKEFDGTVNRIAAGLSKQGVKKGDHVALLLGIQLEFPLGFFALMKLGAMVVPLNTRFKGEELAYEINDSESLLPIVDGQFWPQIVSVRGELKTVEKIFYTGSDGPEGHVLFSFKGA